MNLSHILFLKILMLQVIGAPFAYLFDSQGWFFNYASMVDKEYMIRSYLWSIYAVGIFAVSYFFTGSHKLVKQYQKRQVVFYSKSYLTKVWLISFAAGLVITLILLVQNDFVVPGFAAFGRSYREFLEIRMATQSRINVNLLNLGTSLFLVLSLSIALFFIKRPTIILLTIGQAVLLCAFSLEKATISDVVFSLMIFYFLYKRPSLMILFKGMIIFICAICLMYILSKTATSIEVMALAIFRRIIYGQFLALPFYFASFAGQKMGYFPLLPPYVQNLFGGIENSPARVVMENYINPQGVIEGIAGVASTFFIGDAYAVCGNLGIIIAPFLVSFNFFITIALFSRLKKSIWNIFIYSYLFNKLQYGLFGSISAFVLSGFHIIFIAFIFTKLFFPLKKSTFSKMETDVKATA